MIIWSVCLFVSRENEWEKKGFGEEVEGGTIYKYQSNNRERFTCGKVGGYKRGRDQTLELYFHLWLLSSRSCCLLLHGKNGKRFWWWGWRDYQAVRMGSWKLCEDEGVTRARVLLVTVLCVQCGSQLKWTTRGGVVVSSLDSQVSTLDQLVNRVVTENSGKVSSLLWLN